MSAPELATAFELDHEWPLLGDNIEAIAKVYVLRFDTHPFMQLTVPEHHGPPTPWPTYDTGFLKGPAPTPVWELAPTWLPTGTELWQISADNMQDLVAIFQGIGKGWVAVQGAEFPHPAPYTAPSLSIGPRATWKGGDYPIDFNEDGTLTLVAPIDKVFDGFELVRPEAATKTVTRDECESIYSVTITGTVDDCKVYILARERKESLVQLIDPSWETVQSLKANPVDLNTFQARVRDRKLKNVQGVRHELA